MGRQGGRVPKEERIKLMHDVDMLMRHPLMIHFFERAEERVFTQWKQAETAEEREKLWLAKCGLEAFREFTQSLIIDGKMAERDLQEKLHSGNL